MRYEEVPAEVEKIAGEVKDKFFPELDDCLIKVLFDVSTRKKNFIAKIIRPNELLRFFTADETESEHGYDFIIVVDQLVWDSGISDMDRKRILRHEFRHILFDPERPNRNAMYKLRKHSVEDFYEEIELAEKEGDVRWMERVKLVAESVYDGEAEDADEV
jgi:hypothetical protein